MPKVPNKVGLARNGIFEVQTSTPMRPRIHSRSSLGQLTNEPPVSFPEYT